MHNENIECKRSINGISSNTQLDMIVYHCISIKYSSDEYSIRTIQCLLLPVVTMNTQPFCVIPIANKDS